MAVGVNEIQDITRLDFRGIGILRSVNNIVSVMDIFYEVGSIGKTPDTAARGYFGSL